MASPPLDQVGVGVVVPHDMALDRELWRWVPPDVSLYLTRTTFSPLPVTLEMITQISDEEAVASGTRALGTSGAQVFAYACTSGSFVRGVAGERALVAAMHTAGAPTAVTTSGALLRALARLEVDRVAVATPYDQAITAKLADFLDEAGVHLTADAYLGLARDIAKVPYDVTADLIRRADHHDAEAIFVSCTNLPTYDLIAPLEAELGKPVITANQVTMWACLSEVGRPGVGPGQRLLST